MWDADNLIAQARAARAAGADIVLVQYHGGDEYCHAAERRSRSRWSPAHRARPTSTWCSASTPTSCSRSPGSTGSGSSTAWATWSPSRTRPGPTPTRASWCGSRSPSGARPVRGHPRGVRPDRVERLAPRLRADPRRAAARRGRRPGDVVRRGAGRPAGAAPALIVSRRCRRSRPVGSPLPRRPGPRRRCRRT